MFWQNNTIASITGVEWTELLGGTSFSLLLAMLLAWLLLFPIFLFTGYLASIVWDDYVDARGFFRKMKMPKKDKQELNSLLTKLKTELSKSD